jgi:hypothetical protein
MTTITAIMPGAIRQPSKKSTRKAIIAGVLLILSALSILGFVLVMGFQKINFSRIIEQAQRQSKQQRDHNVSVTTIESTPRQLPVTQFTEHVLEVVRNYRLPETWNATCDMHIHLYVDAPYSIPSKIDCVGVLPEFKWCRVMKMIFEDKVLPYNISLGFQSSDFEEADRTSCLASSSPHGKLCVPNMNDVWDMAMYDNSSFWKDHENHRGNPWDERISIPIFRGTAWWPLSSTFAIACGNASTDLETLISTLSTRFKVVYYAKSHSYLLNAKFSDIPKSNDEYVQPCYERLVEQMPLNPIKSSYYFDNYQIALVLNGLGAAFRTRIHFQHSTAVILQSYLYEEWFTKFLVPWEHYIPLPEDLQDLTKILHWVHTHPREVKEIADNGRKFYEKYLTFERNGQHIYEMVYRLSEHYDGEYEFPTAIARI